MLDRRGSSKRRFFGTDGIRGKANEAPMTPEIILTLARAIAVQFTQGVHRPVVVIGKDTRLSGYMIETALCSGFVSMGVDVVLLGPLPTPAVAMLTRSLRADVGVMISASHNSYEDNGIKLFGPDGNKLSDEQEATIEACMDENIIPTATPENIGKARHLDHVSGRYIEFVKASFPLLAKGTGLGLDGIKLVVDCAHGAAYRVAPTVLWELGAEVISIGTHPNGININKACGAADLKAAQAAVKKHKAQGAVILDGDADRLILLDETGCVFDGDAVLGVIAAAWQAEGKLKGPGVVATQMSNLGLERYLKAQGLDLIRTAVGDRYVLEAMRKHGCNLGGEQSGHIILGDYTTTGDGLMAALQVLSVAIEKDQPLSQICSAFDPVPQLSETIRVPKKGAICPNALKGVQQDMRKKLKDGHLLVRLSGTEPVIRLMVQGDSPDILKSVMDELAQAIQSLSVQAA